MRSSAVLGAVELEFCALPEVSGGGMELLLAALRKVTAPRAVEWQLRELFVMMDVRD